MKRIATALVLGGLMAAAAERSHASVVLVTDRAVLGGNETIDWGQLGPTQTQITNPVTVTASGGSSSVATQVSGKGIRLDQGNGYNGNFAFGDHLYYTQNQFDPTNQGPITLTFAAPVRGVGTQIMENYFGTFTAFISAYDSSHNLLGTFTEAGSSNSNGDNSAIFIGISSTGADIASVTFGISAAQNGPVTDFAINQVSLSTAAVPEPSSLALAGVAGLGLLGYARRRKVRA